jgi:hypothetical protein
MIRTWDAYRSSAYQERKKMAWWRIERIMLFKIGRDGSVTFNHTMANKRVGIMVVGGEVSCIQSHQSSHPKPRCCPDRKSSGMLNKVKKECVWISDPHAGKEGRYLHT